MIDTWPRPARIEEIIVCREERTPGCQDVHLVLVCRVYVSAFGNNVEKAMEYARLIEEKIGVGE